ncbi:MAG: WD40 repeat domain-containing protein, partial [Promethearchaeota archaeon]
HGDGAILRVGMDDHKDTIELRGHSDVVSTMSINPSGSLLASGSWDRTLRVWSLDDFREIASEKLVTGIASLEWSRDKDVIYSADFSGSIVSWSL